MVNETRRYKGYTSLASRPVRDPEAVSQGIDAMIEAARRGDAGVVLDSFAALNVSASSEDVPKLGVAFSVVSGEFVRRQEEGKLPGIIRGVMNQIARNEPEKREVLFGEVVQVMSDSVVRHGRSKDSTVIAHAVISCARGIDRMLSPVGASADGRCGGYEQRVRDSYLSALQRSSRRAISCGG